MENNLVIKANKLNESRYKLSIQEQRVVLTMISMIEPDDVDFKPYSFQIKDFLKLAGLKGQSAYSEIRKVTRSLLSKTFTIGNPSGSIQIGWVSSAQYFDKEGRVELSFDPKLKPYLLALRQEFTRYQLKNTIRLKSVYSVRIYELLKQYQGIGSRTFDLEELRGLVGLTDDRLNLYGNFKVKVLNKAQSELKKTDISFTFTPVKTSRRVTGIVFTIFKNDDIVKKSYKKKAKTVTDPVPDLDLENKKEQAAQKERKKILSSLRSDFPDKYAEFEKKVQKRFTKKEQKKPGYKLSLVLKMESLVLGFVQSKGLNL